MFITDSRPEAIANRLGALDLDANEAIYLMVGEEAHPDLDALVAALNACDIPFFGGVFPGLLHNGRRYTRGVIALPLPVQEPPCLVTGLDTTDIVFPEHACASIHDGNEPAPTAVVLVDGLTSNIALFLQELYNRLGNRVHYFGGGAGSLSLRQAPCLFSPEGVFQDAALIAFLPMNSGLGVRHGWERLTGPFVATRTEKNVIHELNWETAFDVYRDAVDADAGSTLTPESFFDTAKGYPFGIYKEGVEDIVRDPITVTDDGALVCVGDVPNNTSLYILKGRAGSLVASARQAARDCLDAVDGQPQTGLVADCISRVLFLEEGFSEELNAIGEQFTDRGLEPPDGMLTLGEISSYGAGLLELFNKTTVALALHAYPTAHTE